MAFKNKTINNVDNEVDAVIGSILKSHPVELKKIRDNEQFIKEVEFKSLPVEDATIPVFGTSVDLNAILKNNIWDRTAYFVDMQCDGFAHMTSEQLKKYLAKKRKMPNNLMMIFIILMFVGIGMVVLILFLTGVISL